MHGRRKLKRVYTIQPAPLTKVRQQQVLALYSDGKTIPVIADMLSMRRQDVSRDLNIALSDMVKQYALPSPEQNFVRLAAFQMGVIQKLRESYETFTADPEARQYGAAVSALKAQSEIYDRLIAKGIEFGIIQQSKAKESIRATPKDLRLELRKEIKTLTILLDEVDNHTNVQSLAVNQPSRMLPPHDPKTRSSHTRIMRRVQRNELGVIRAIPDWKYRQTLYDNTGRYKPQYSRTDDDKRFLPPEDPTTVLQRELAREQGQVFVETKHGIPAEVIPDQTKTNHQQPKPIKATATITQEQSTWLVKPSR
jgi:hypothetical protein